MLHDADGGLAHQEAAAQVHGQHAVEGIGGLLQGGQAGVADARVVDQRIDAAPARLHRVDGRLHIGRLGDVAAQAEVVGAEFGGAGLGGVGTQVQQGHLPAVGREALRRGPADAVGRAGDHGHPAVHRAAPARSAMWWAVTQPNTMFGPCVMPAPG